MPKSGSAGDGQNPQRLLRRRKASTRWRSVVWRLCQPGDYDSTENVLYSPASDNPWYPRTRTRSQSVQRFALSLTTLRMWSDAIRLLSFRYRYTVYVCAGAWYAQRRNTVQQLLRKTVNFVSPELLLQHASAKLNWLQDLGSLQQREYELQVNKIEEIKQRLVELWQRSYITFEWKYVSFRVSVLPGSAKALLRRTILSL